MYMCPWPDRLVSSYGNIWIRNSVAGWTTRALSTTRARRDPVVLSRIEDYRRSFPTSSACADRLGWRLSRTLHRRPCDIPLPLERERR